MKVQINARGETFNINLPDTLVERAVTYALGVIAQRETAGMGDKDRKPDGKPYTEKDRLDAIRGRFARIAKGEWEAGGRAADPITREVCALLRVAGVRKAAKPDYKPDAVPGASTPDKVAAFMNAHFTAPQIEKLVAKAKAIAAVKSTGDTL
jgi:hypothetical protein